MPPPRKGSLATVATPRDSRQQTLKFKKSSEAKITKSVPTPTNKNTPSSKSKSRSPSAPAISSTPIPAPPPPAPSHPLLDDLTPTEQKALTLPLATLQNYHATQVLGERLCPPTHQEDLCMQEKVLRHFDMTLKYGPCTGITRLQRWKRAEELGLNPPIEVLAVILGEEVKEGAGVGGDAGRDTRMAYVDWLLSGKSLREA